MLAVPLTDYYEEVRRYRPSLSDLSGGGQGRSHLRRQPESDGPKRRSA